MGIKRVVLYENGVGWFLDERRVRDAEALELRFRVDELDEVLKSFLWRDLDGGEVLSFDYPGPEPDAGRLHIDGKRALREALVGLGGAAVELEEAGTRTSKGRVLGVEERELADGEVQTEVVIATEEGELRATPLAGISSLRLLEDGPREELQRTLDASLRGLRKESCPLVLRTRGEGERRLLLGYLLDFPCWKATWALRLRGGESKKGYLEGHAIVDNDRDEPWEGVELVLVSGTPASWRWPLRALRRGSRPEVAQHSLGAIDDDAFEESPAAGRHAGFAPEPMSMGAPMMAPPPAPARPPARIETHEKSALVAYTIPHPISMGGRRSARVPIVATDVEAERIAHYAIDDEGRHPDSALRFVNDSDVPLIGGPLVIHDEDRYVGEAILDAVPPAAERILAFAVETSCRMRVLGSQREESEAILSCADGVLVAVRIRRERTRVFARNEASYDLDLILDLERRLDEEVEADSTEGWQGVGSKWRLRTRLPAREEKEFTIVTSTGQESRHVLLDMNLDDCVRLLVHAAPPPSWDLNVVELMDLHAELSGIEREIEDFQRRRERQESDLERKHAKLENLGERGEEGKLRARIVRDLGAGEDFIESMDAQIQERKKDRQRLRKQLRARIRKLAES